MSKDTSCEPRSDQELINAANMIRKEMVTGKVVPQMIHYPVIIDAIYELLESRKYSNTYKIILKNLLAVIHRDGGDYTGKHGLKKSVDDAITKVVDLIHSNS